jgi:hypothetical protein
MKTLEVLDAILYYLSNNRIIVEIDTIEQYIDKNYENLKDEILISKLQNALDKLVEEKYIVITKLPIEDTIKKSEFEGYYITWEGDFFIQQGGFVGKLLKENSEKERIKELEINQETTNKTMLSLNNSLGIMTKWIMIATLVAGVYYALEILNHFINIYPTTK